MRRFWRAASMALVVGWGCATGCTSTPSGPGPVMLRGTYDAVGPGAYLRMTFYDPQHFFLFRSPCDLTRATSANACMESGTYAVDPVHNVLALRDVRTGTITELTFSVLSVAPSVSATRLRTLGDPLVGNGGSLVGDGGSLTGDGGSLTGDAGSLVVKDGGLLSFGDAGLLTGDAGAKPVQSFNANGQPFQAPTTPDGGSSLLADGGTMSPAAGDAGSSSMGAGSGSGAGGSPSGGMPSSGSGSGGSPSSPSAPSTAGTDAGGAAADAGANTTSVNLLYEGSCAFLKKCDSFSKKAPAGSVVFGCTGTTPCSDSDPYVAGPSKAYCGKVVTFCTSGGQCTNGTVKDTSNVHGWEGGRAVMQGLGFGSNDGTCSSGGSGGGQVTASF